MKHAPKRLRVFSFAEGGGLDDLIFFVLIKFPSSKNVLKDVPNSIHTLLSHILCREACPLLTYIL